MFFDLVLFYFVLLGILVFELRASYLLDRHFYHLSHTNSLYTPMFVAASFTLSHVEATKMSING
jgi:hypothetical protein